MENLLGLAKCFVFLTPESNYVACGVLTCNKCVRYYNFQPYVVFFIIFISSVRYRNNRKNREACSNDGPKIIYFYSFLGVLGQGSPQTHQEPHGCHQGGEQQAEEYHPGPGTSP